MGHLEWKQLPELQTPSHCDNARLRSCPYRIKETASPVTRRWLERIVRWLEKSKKSRRAFIIHALLQRIIDYDYFIASRRQYCSITGFLEWLKCSTSRSPTRLHSWSGSCTLTITLRRDIIILRPCKHIYILLLKIKLNDLITTAQPSTSVCMIQL
jgi:hypothetical protein